MNDRFRAWARDAFDILCFVGVIYCGWVGIQYRFANPTLTETQLFLDLMYYCVFCIIASVYLSVRLR